MRMMAQDSLVHLGKSRNIMPGTGESFWIMRVLMLIVVVFKHFAHPFEFDFAFFEFVSRSDVVFFEFVFAFDVVFFEFVSISSMNEIRLWLKLLLLCRL
jgi:hypothetical protein